MLERRVPPALGYLWDFFEEIGPLAPGADLNGAIAHWSAATRTRISPREFVILKRMFMAVHMAIGQNPTGERPSMLPATAENVSAVLGGFGTPRSLGQPRQKRR